VISVFDLLGDLLILNSDEPLPGLLNYSKIRSVWRKTTPVSSEFRIHNYSLVRGENISESTSIESGYKVRFSLYCYYNARYASERLNLARVMSGDSLCILGAGVGVYSLYLSKNFKSVCSVEPNLICQPLFAQNMLFNRVYNSSLLSCRGSDILKKNRLFFTDYLIVMPLQFQISLQYIHRILKYSMIPVSSIVVYLKMAETEKIKSDLMRLYSDISEVHSHKVKTYSALDAVYRITIRFK
jgi:tRNA G37 N-methylase Trm5